MSDIVLSGTFVCMFLLFSIKGRARDFEVLKKANKECLRYKGYRGGERLVTVACDKGIQLKRKVLCQTVSGK